MGDALTLLQTDDQELLLAAQAVAQVAAVVRHEQYEELAKHIIGQLSKAMNK